MYRNGWVWGTSMRKWNLLAVNRTNNLLIEQHLEDLANSLRHSSIFYSRISQLLRKYVGLKHM